LAAGDFDGDDLDDLAVGARSVWFWAVGTEGLSTASDQVELSYADLG
jgi:hypothetical protein